MNRRGFHSRRVKTRFPFRVFLGIVGAVLIFASPLVSHSRISSLEVQGPLLVVGVGLAIPSLLGGVFGAVVSYWKRGFGGIFMLLAGMWGFVPSISCGNGWGFLGSIVLIGCSISSFWHRLD